jgi:hypothetical protein
MPLWRPAVGIAFTFNRIHFLRSDRSFLANPRIRIHGEALQDGVLIQFSTSEEKPRPV